MTTYDIHPPWTLLAGLPRFGRPDDVSAIFSGDPHQASSYLFGLVFVGALTVLFFGTWAIALVAFKLQGPKRTGFLSGHPFVVDALTTSSSSGLSPTVNGTTRSSTSPNREGDELRSPNENEEMAIDLSFHDGEKPIKKNAVQQKRPESPPLGSKPSSKGEKSSGKKKATAEQETSQEETSEQFRGVEGVAQTAEEENRIFIGEEENTYEEHADEIQFLDSEQRGDESCRSHPHEVEEEKMLVQQADDENHRGQNKESATEHQTVDEIKGEEERAIDPQANVMQSNDHKEGGIEEENSSKQQNVDTIPMVNAKENNKLAQQEVDAPQNLKTEADVEEKIGAKEEKTGAREEGETWSSGNLSSKEQGHKRDNSAKDEATPGLQIESHQEETQKTNEERSKTRSNDSKGQDQVETRQSEASNEEAASSLNIESCGEKKQCTDNEGSTTQRMGCVSHCHGHLPTLIRILFLLFGIGFIVASVLLVTHGINSLQSTVLTVSLNADAIHSAAVELESIHRETFDMWGIDWARATRDVMMTEYGNSTQFCPADPDMEEHPKLHSRLERAHGALEALGDFVASEIRGLLEMAGSVRDGSEQVLEAVEPGLSVWIAPGILVFSILLPSSLMFGTSLALLDRTGPALRSVRWFNNWIAMPLFVVLVTVSILASAVVAMASGANSDFCLPGGTIDAGGGSSASSSDAVVLNIVRRAGYPDKTTTFLTVNWFVRQCDADQAENPFTPFQEFLVPARDAEIVLEEINATTFSNQTELAQLAADCQVEDFTWIASLTDGMIAFLRQVATTFSDLADLVRCDVLVDMYTTSIHDGVCHDSVSAFFWTYWTTLSMGFLGMLMITFRASYQPSTVTTATTTQKGVSQRSNHPVAESSARAADTDEEGDSGEEGDEGESASENNNTIKDNPLIEIPSFEDVLGQLEAQRETSTTVDAAVTRSDPSIS